MNDFQMSYLSNDRRDSYMAEARRERLARAARPAPTRAHDARVRRPRRLSLGLLFGRTGA